MILVAVMLFAALGSCTKSDNSTPDPCSGIYCQNGGTCSGGVCTCPTGWTGTNCQTPVATSTIGFIDFINTSTNPYYIYIGGVYKNTIAGKTYILYSISAGSYSCEVKQQSGYVLYPTDETFTATVTTGNTFTITFP